MNQPQKLLFVCTENRMRSLTAEALMELALIDKLKVALREYVEVPE